VHKGIFFLSKNRKKLILALKQDVALKDEAKTG
jgi:hypothetical protein